MRIIALPDLHDGGTRYLEKIETDLRTCDLVLLVGDLTNSGRAAECARIVDAVRQYNPTILAVPGNWDTHEAGNYITQEGINLHASHKIVDGIAFAGVGGSLKGIGSPNEFTEIQLENFLHDSISGLMPETPLVLISHQPPANTLNARASTGIQLGSQSVRRFISRHQPLICFTGHIHEGRGIDTIGHTKIVNPGPIWHGHYAYAEIIMGNVVTIEIRKI